MNTYYRYTTVKLLGDRWETEYVKCAGKTTSRKTTGKNTVEIYANKPHGL